MIALERVSKWYGTFQVLADCTMAVATGEVVVICGPSGSGKSTLIKCINGLEPFEQGSITVDGVPVGDKATNLPRLRSRIGMVFQNFELFAHLTALENIVLAPVQVKGLPKAEAVGLARALLEKVRIPEKADFYPDELSGGQQQRVAIARALAMKPKVMLYDEPTSALDPEMIKEVLDVIQDLSREGITGMVVTHEMAFARRIADRVLFMDAGQIVDDAPSADFFHGTSSERAKRFLQQILHH